MIAHTRSGDVSGIERDGVWMFRGIPYAAPPVGPLRFRPPQPAEPWAGVRDGSRFSAMAPQGVGGLEAMLGAGKFAQSEDCLSLNVSTPAADDGRRPVLVWIHGGGFQTGSGSVPWYHGTRLAGRDDVVVVSINYRLGVLGFTHLGPALGEAYAGSGNCGILDQIAALGWVRDNIEAFGGDPANVTIFGESAGGMSVGTLLGTPAAAGLFRRAIAESGACQALSTAEEAASRAELVAQEVGGFDALLTAPVEEVLAAQNAVATPLTGSFGSEVRPTGLLPFQPVVDGVVVPVQPLDAVAGGSAAGIDLIAGTTAHEFTLFLMTMPADSLDEDRLQRRVERMVGADRAAAVIDSYRRRIPGATAAELIAAVYTDTVFRLPCEELLAAHAAASTGGSTRTYLFTYESPAFEGRLGATHAIEIPFVFGVVDRPGNELFLGPIEDSTRALADSTSQAWTTFARSGTPAAPGLPEWPAWDADRRATMELGLRCRVLDDPSAPARAVWTGPLVSRPAG